MAVFDTFVYGAAILTLFARMALREERATRLDEAIEREPEIWRGRGSMISPSRA